LTTATTAAAGPQSIARIIGAASLGTMIEWYDFYIFGSLSVFMTEVFYPKGDPVWTEIAFWATFATGFIVRPFGAVVFGRVGDLVGRKYAFLVTLLVMGLATFVIGLLPSYEKIGLLAPFLLILLRLVQGLALGGEYGGAAVYVAEHAPDGKRGLYTSFIQTTATLGLFISLAVILAVRSSMSDAAFRQWGWRLPFLASIFLVAISLYIRLRMKESPLFSALKKSGKTSLQPLRDAFGNWANLKVVLLVLFGAQAGQGVVWYTAQFWALAFLMGKECKVPYTEAYVIMAAALAIGTPFFVFFGWLSDRIGRKKIMMAGNLVAALTFYPIFQALKHYSNPFNMPMLIALVTLLVLYATMVYGPIAAFLVEAFPAKIRYTSLSVPYHLGNGWFGGTVPLIATWLVARTGHTYASLWFPIAVASITFVVGSLLLKESHQVRIWDEVSAGGSSS
jgi:MFS family permease